MKRRTERGGAALRLGVILLSVALIAMGVARREHLTVLEKAVRLCLECVGIG